MLKVPEFFKYPEWYDKNPKYVNEIGIFPDRYIIKENAPDFIKKSYEDYLKDVSAVNDFENIID